LVGPRDRREIPDIVEAVLGKPAWLAPDFDQTFVSQPVDLRVVDAQELGGVAECQPTGRHTLVLLRFGGAGRVSAGLGN